MLRELWRKSCSCWRYLQLADSAKNGKQTTNLQSLTKKVVRTCAHTVHLTSVDNPVPGNQEFCLAPSETIVELVKNEKSQLGHSLRMVTSGDMLGCRLYILLKSHSSFCCLLSNLNFELLKSVMHTYLYALARNVRENQIMAENE